MKANCDGSNRGTVRMTLRHKQAVVRRIFSSLHVVVKLAKLTLSAQQSLKKNMRLSNKKSGLRTDS